MTFSNVGCKFTVKANQRLSFEVLGRRLGSVFDPQITLYDATGKELPAGHSNDTPIPNGRAYNASASVKPTTANFDAIYGAPSPVSGTRPAIEPVLTM